MTPQDLDMLEALMHARDADARVEELTRVSYSACVTRGDSYNEAARLEHALNKARDRAHASSGTFAKAVLAAAPAMIAALRAALAPQAETQEEEGGGT